MQSEALLTCSCGMRGLGVNGRLEQRVGFAWALFRNEFSKKYKFFEVILFQFGVIISHFGHFTSVWSEYQLFRSLNCISFSVS